MKPWRFGSPWPEEALRQWLTGLVHTPVNFAEALEEMTPENRWKIERTEALIGREVEGPPLPDDSFSRAKRALVRYEFSEPRICQAYFDPEAPMLGRTMPLEFKALGFRFLNGVWTNEDEWPSPQRGWRRAA